MRDLVSLNYYYSQTGELRGGCARFAPQILKYLNYIIWWALSAPAREPLRGSIRNGNENGATDAAGGGSTWQTVQGTGTGEGRKDANNYIE